MTFRLVNSSRDGPEGADANEGSGSSRRVPSLAPILIVLPAMKRPSTDIPLDVFEAAAVPKAGNGQATANRKKRKILVGETDRIQLGGRTVEDADQYECHYALVAYDPETQIAEIQGAPSVRASRMVKATVSSSTASPASKVIRRKNLDARNVLGEAFGSKKRQQQIRSYERNQVEMDTMGDVVGLVSSVIDDRVANSSVPVSSTPSDASRPPYDLKAEKPEDAYQLDEVIPPNDLTEMDVSDLMRVTATDLKSTLVAYGIVEHSLIYARLEKELNKPAKQRSTDRVKRMVYVALMFQFFSVLSGPYKAYQDPTALAGRMGGISLSIAQSLLNRFAMQKSQEAGKTSYGTTSQLRDKLACYIIIACLSLDNYEFDINSLAKDLKQSNKKITDLAKYVGCKMVKMSAADAKSAGIEGQPVKAVLSVPLTFPLPSRGAMRR